MLTVTELNHIEQLESYRLAWRSLWQQTRYANFFQSLDWLQVYWRHFGTNQRLHVLVVADGHRPIGILPLTVISEPTRLGPVEVLTYPLHDWGVSFGPISPQPTVTLLTALRYLNSQPRSWQWVDLRWIVPGVDASRTKNAMQLAGMSPWSGTWTTTAVIDFQRTWPEYLATRTGKFRSNLNRAQSGSQRVGLRYERYRSDGIAGADADPRWDLFDACCLVSERSWQAASKSGTTISDPKISSFIRETHLAASRQGAADMNLLWLDDTPIAYSYNYVSQGNLFGLRQGYDPEFANLSPGRMLLAHSIQDSFVRGDQQLDLGPGSIAIKRPWMTREVSIERCSHYPLTSSRCQLLRLKRFLFDQRFPRLHAS